MHSCSYELLTQFKIIILDIPECILVAQVGVARDFLLFEAPLRKLFSGRCNSAVLKVMNQLEFTADRVNRITFSSIYDKDLEDIVGVASSVL